MLLKGDNWANYFERLTNAKGKLVKSSIQDRAIALKQQVEKNDVPDSYKVKVEPIGKAFEKLTNWEKGIQHTLFAELDVLWDYLTLMADQSELKKGAKKEREVLVTKLQLMLNQHQEGEGLAEIRTIQTLLDLTASISQLSSDNKEANKALEEKVLEKYAQLTPEEVKVLVVDDKWLTNISTSIQGEIDAISQRLTGRIKELAERYEFTLGEIESEVEELENKVDVHLQKMVLGWS